MSEYAFYEIDNLVKEFKRFQILRDEDYDYSSDQEGYDATNKLENISKNYKNARIGNNRRISCNIIRTK